MNTQVKGRTAQRRCRELLEKEGWTVGYCGKTSRWTKDLFGLFDIVAIKQGEMRFIQVTCNTPHTHLLFAEFQKKYCLWDQARVEQWVWIDRKGFMKYRYYPGQEYTITKVPL